MLEKRSKLSQVSSRRWDTAHHPSHDPSCHLPLCSLLTDSGDPSAAHAPFTLFELQIPRVVTHIRHGETLELRGSEERGEAYEEYMEDDNELEPVARTASPDDDEEFQLTEDDAAFTEGNEITLAAVRRSTAGYAAYGYARSSSSGIGACAATFIIGGLLVINAIVGAYSENILVIYIVGGLNSNEFGINVILHHTMRSAISPMS